MLVLHIGRGKVGSTTIQHAIIADRDRLKEQGILLPEGAARHAGNYVQLARALREDTAIPDEFPGLLADNPDKTIFVSSEFLLTLPQAAIERLRPLLGRHEVKVFAYVREYRAWVRSWYLQSARTGKSRVNFDAFFKSGWPLFSLKAQIEPWVAVFGWDSVEVRPAGAPLTTGDLLGDLGKLLGFVFSPSQDKNISPSWLEVEFCKVLISHHRGQKLELADIVAIVGLLRHCIEKIKLPKVEYLTLHQRHELVQLFNEDAAWMLSNTGKSFSPLQMTDTAERPFLPSLAHAPNGFLASVASAAAAYPPLKARPVAKAAILAICGQHSSQSRPARLVSHESASAFFPWETPS